MKHPDAKPPYIQPEKGKCRWCWGAVPKGRRTFCSNACVDEYRRVVDWRYVCELVLRRDRGVCAICGVDTLKIRRVFEAWRADAKARNVYVYNEAKQIQAWIGMNRSTYVQYQVDHITPRHDGGTNELTNLRTLCVPCHKDVTTAFAGERARRRRNAKVAGHSVSPSLRLFGSLL